MATIYQVTQKLEVNTLLEVSSTKKQFNELYTKKYGVVIGKLDSDTKKSKELSSFDKKLVTALNYNWKEENETN